MRIGKRCGDVALFFQHRMGQKQKEGVRGLVDKVESHRSTIDYKVEECVYSRRSCLQVGSELYCLLSRADDYHHCPLQEVESGRSLFQCRRSEYIWELNKRNR